MSAAITDNMTREVGVNVGAIEKELAAMWRSASKEKQVTRACSWNLIVHASDDALFDAIKPVVHTAVRAVPSRTLLLKQKPYATGHPVEAWVSANCQIAPGGGKLLCTEEITIEARGKEGTEHLPSLIRALLVPDVPTALWWAGPPPTDASAIRILLSGVDRFVFDTANFSEDSGLSKLAHVGGLLEGLVLSDLNWLRTAGWRSVLASLFDPPVGSEPLTRLNRVQIDATQKGVPAAKLLVGWLASRLAWGAPERVEKGHNAWRVPVRGEQPVRVDIETTKVTTTRESGIKSITLEASPNEKFSLVDVGSPALEAQAPGIPTRTLQAHELNAVQLLIASLGSRGRDKLYAVALHRAVELDR